MPGFTRRAAMTGSLATLLAPCGAQAQSWPNGQIVHVIVPFAPGGSTDAIARMMQEGMQRRLATTIIIDNRPGGDSAIGAALAARAQPDGLTFLNVFDSHAALPALRKLPFDVFRDLDPVMLIGQTSMVVACQKDKPYKTFDDVVAAAKAKPGTLTFATIGNGSLGHLGMTLLEKLGGFSLIHVPYNGGGPAMNAALGGQVDMIIGSAALPQQQIDVGNMRPLLQTGAERLPKFKDTPTAIEAGFKDFVALSWWAVFAPAKTPRAIVDQYVNAMRETLQDPAVVKQLQETQQVHVMALGPEEFGKFYKQQAEIWGAVVRDNNIKAD